MLKIRFYFIYILFASISIFFDTGNAKAGYYVTIHSALDGRCLEADMTAAPGTSGARVQMWACNGSPQQLWYVDALPGNVDWGSLKNQYSGTCLDSQLVFTSLEALFDGSMSRDGRAVVTWPCNVPLMQSKPQQLWQIRGQRLLSPFANTVMQLDYNPGRAGNGGEVYLWTGAERLPPQQVWMLEAAPAPKPPVSTTPAAPVTPPPSLDHWFTFRCVCDNGNWGMFTKCLRDASAQPVMNEFCKSQCWPLAWAAVNVGQPSSPCNL